MSVCPRPCSPHTSSPTLVCLPTALTPSRPYYLGSHIMPLLAQHLKSLQADRLFLICDDAVWSLHGATLLQQLQQQNLPIVRFSAAGGEACKTLSALDVLSSQLITAGATKDSLLLALGGGAVGNLVGMAAALLFRGIRFVQIPTTLMAQTDSTLSNKQAVNTPVGKNLLGVYYPPEFIWADTTFPLTEDSYHLRSALVESVKNGLISEPAFLDYLDSTLDTALAKDPAALHDIAHRSVLSKLHILERDPTERAYALSLEYGHTFGHAIEKLSAGQLSHGHAVAIGMTLAARISHHLGYLDAAALQRHSYFLGERLQLPLTLPARLSPQHIMDVIKADNKRSAAGVRYVLLRVLGQPLNPDQHCLTAVPDEVVHEALAQAF